MTNNHFNSNPSIPPRNRFVFTNVSFVFSVSEPVCDQTSLIYIDPLNANLIVWKLYMSIRLLKRSHLKQSGKCINAFQANCIFILHLRAPDIMYKPSNLSKKSLRLNAVTNEQCLIFVYIIFYQ